MDGLGMLGRIRLTAGGMTHRTNHFAESVWASHGSLRAVIALPTWVLFVYEM